MEKTGSCNTSQWSMSGSCRAATMNSLCWGWMNVLIIKFPLIWVSLGLIISQWRDWIKVGISY